MISQQKVFDGDEPLTLISIEQLKLRDINYESNTSKMGGSASVLAYITSDIPGAPLNLAAL